VCIIDIGAGTTDLAVYTQGAIRHTAVLPAAGDMITNDIAMALRTPTAEAETIKLEHGAARHDWVDPEEMIEVAPVGEPSGAASVAPAAGRRDPPPRRGDL